MNGKGTWKAVYTRLADQLLDTYGFGPKAALVARELCFRARGDGYGFGSWRHIRASIAERTGVEVSERTIERVRAWLVERAAVVVRRLQWRHNLRRTWGSLWYLPAIGGRERGHGDLRSPKAMRARVVLLPVPVSEPASSEASRQQQGGSPANPLPPTGLIGADGAVLPRGPVATRLADGRLVIA